MPVSAAFGSINHNERSLATKTRHFQSPHRLVVSCSTSCGAGSNLRSQDGYSFEGEEYHVYKK